MRNYSVVVDKRNEGTEGISIFYFILGDIMSIKTQYGPLARFADIPITEYVAKRTF